MEEWYKEVGDLQVQAASIPQQGQVKETVAERQTAVESRMVRLIEPLKERRRILLASKEVHQVGRDLEDEIVSGMSVSYQHICTVHTHVGRAVCSQDHVGRVQVKSKTRFKWSLSSPKRGQDRVPSHIQDQDCN